MVVRLLMLPGFSQNATVFHKKCAAIQKACGKAVEFVFLEPPIVLEAADLGGLSTSSLDSTSSFDPTTPELRPRAWWRANEDRTIYYGADVAIQTLRDFLAQQTIPFDGVFGFSQGAAVAALLTALCEYPTQYPDFLIDGRSPHPPLKFGVFVSGFKPIDHKIRVAFDAGKLKTPSLHILGRGDVIVGEKRSQTLVDACESPRVERHDGGHFVPAKASWRNFFKAYLTSFDVMSTTTWEDVPSPMGVASADSSAISTPLQTRPSSPPAPDHKL